MKIRYRPFLLASLLWVCLGSFVAALYGQKDAFLTFFSLFLLAVFNLYFLGKTITRLLTYMQSRASSDAFGIFFFGNAKLLMLVLIGWVSYQNRNQNLAVFLGCTTLFWVPFVGGLLWSKRENG